MKKLNDIQEVRTILKATLDKIGAELDWEYQDAVSEQSTYVKQKGEIDTSFIEDYKDIIE